MNIYYFINNKNPKVSKEKKQKETETPHAAAKSKPDADKKKVSKEKKQKETETPHAAAKSKPDTDKKNEPSAYSYEAVDSYEEAVNLVGFGWFNVMVLLWLIPMELAMQFQMYGMSYAMLQVECDLNLGNLFKGLLITTNIIGMIPTGLLWNLGADVFGRRKVIIIGMFAHTLVRIGEALSVNFIMLVIFELLGGMIICGPYAIYLGAVFDFASSKKRKLVLLIYFLIICLTNNLIALIAWFVMRNNYHVFDIFFEWNVFMAVAIAPSLLGFIGAIILPESPKYLLRASRESDALTVLRHIGNVNKAKVRLSADNVPEKQPPINYKRMFRKSMTDIKSLKPFVFPIIIAAFFQAFTMSAEITLKVWIPTIAAGAVDIGHAEGKENKICYMLDFDLLWRKNDECNLHHDFHTSFFYAFLVSVSIDLSILVFLVINKFPKRTNIIMLPVCVVAAVATFCLFLMSAIWQFVLLVGLFLIIMSAVSVSLITVIYEAFPPNMRLSTPYIFCLTVGRIFVVIVAISFSYVYNIACIAPFALLGCCVLLAGFLSIGLPRRRLHY